jgi:uncharacterized protein (UPF0332 family)
LLLRQNRTEITSTLRLHHASRAALKKANSEMSKRPPIPEIDFLKLTRNHAEFANKLTTLGMSSTAIIEFAKHVGECWLKLADEHLREAKSALRTKSIRSAFSRAYYAAYNTSKALRYLNKGSVSLNGDDHGKAAGDLPDDLPSVEAWSSTITLLYEHRLRADYDNWNETSTKNSITPKEAVKKAESFLDVAKTYMKDKFGIGS